MSGKEHFLVERFNWRPYESPGYLPSEKAARKKDRWARLPGAERVACFETLEEAEDDCRRREEKAREGINPFGGGGLCYLTSFDAGRLHDWVLDLGLSPPGPEGGWHDWWSKQSPRMTELQRSKVWEALDKVRFFRVARAARRIGFVVAGAYWRYNDEYHYREDNGLRPYKVFRTREAADLERVDMEEFSREDWDWQPLGLNGLEWENWSSLTLEEGLARIKALGLTPPSLGPPDNPVDDEFDRWVNWWDDTEMTQEQRAGVWDLLDKNCNWEVIEVELPD